MNVRFEVIGADNLRRTLAIIPRRMFGATRKAMQMALGLIHRHAISVVPVDTGRLKNSLFWDDEYERRGNTLVGAVGTNVEYAAFVEFGTRRIQAQPYLIPAVENNISAINSIFSSSIGNILHG